MKTINAVYIDSIVYFEYTSGEHASTRDAVEQVMANLNTIKLNADIAYSENEAFSEYLDRQFELLSEKLSFSASLPIGTNRRSFELAGLLEETQTTLSIIHKVIGA